MIIKFDNATDNKNGILINTTSLVINGNGHTIDASNQARIFLINASQLVINDLTFINANITEGSALLMVNSNVTTNNVVFKNSVANNGVISASGTKYLSNNDVFKDVTSTKNGVIKLYRSAGTFDNATFTSSKDLVWGFIYDNGNSALIVRNSVFANTTSKYCAAIKGPSKVKITNTTFTNLNAFLSAGAIAAKEMDYFEVDGCTFVNVTSTKMVEQYL